MRLKILHKSTRVRRILIELRIITYYLKKLRIVLKFATLNSNLAGRFPQIRCLGPDDFTAYVAQSSAWLVVVRDRLGLLVVTRFVI